MTPLEQSRGTTRGYARGVTVTPNLLPPSKYEEEESANAPLAGARVAALKTTCPPDLFSNGQSSGEAEASSEAQAFDCPEDIATVVADIATHAGVSIDPGRLGRALVEAMARTAWSGPVIAVYCVEKLKLNRNVHDPAAWLTKDLDSRVNDQIAMSARMQLADALVKLDELADEILSPDDDGDPTVRFERLIIKAGFIDRDSDDMLDAWSAKPAQLEEAVRLATVAMDEARQ